MAVKVAGIQFAPVNVPLDRRLQTAAVLLWVGDLLCFPLISTQTFMLFVAPFVCLLLPFYILICTNYAWVVAVYAIWWVMSRN